MIIDIHSEVTLILNELYSYYDKVKNIMSSLPKDDLHSELKNGKQYYRLLKKNDNGLREYLGNASDPKVSSRLKYQVCNYLIKKIQELIDAFQAIIDTLSLNIDLNDLESEIPEKYKEFPRELFDELGLIDRRELRPQTDNKYKGYNKYLCHETLSGILVRSKSEQIISDRLTVNNLIFKYEPSLPNKNGPEFHPDFSIFSPKYNKWCFLEHIGMISDPKYLDNYKHRLHYYADNKYLIGLDVFFTYDRPDGSIDIKMVDNIISMLTK